jgi:enamine deaminase RidA (YjgF/YER057c/UK114 family)
MNKVTFVRKLISAPKAIGPNSQAIKVGSLVFLSGQIGLDLDPTGKPELSSLDVEPMTTRAPALAWIWPRRCAMLCTILGLI